MTLSEKEFNEIRKLIRDLCGICLGDEKRYLVQSRLEPILHRNKIATYSDLALRCASSLGLQLQEQVVEAITTKETSFNRDGHPFEELRNFILPDLIRSRMLRQQALKQPFGKLRIWSTAASTGQEVYSVAIAILKLLKSPSNAESGRMRYGIENFHILGTDISNEALRIAKAGTYCQRDLDRDYEPASSKEYFIEKNGNFEISDPIRKMVEFRQVNLIRPIIDPTIYDLILCRNILIYFDEPTRNSVLNQLVDRLTPGGILMLGAAESIGPTIRGLTQTQFGRTTAYRKK